MTVHTPTCTGDAGPEQSLVLFEAGFDLTESGPSIRVVRPIKKADLGKWKEATESQLKTLKPNHQALWRRTMPDSVNCCRIQWIVIPQKTVKIRQHAARPCWWNEEVKEAKAEMNSCQKKYKQRNTIQNKDKLVEAESNLEEVKEKAQDEWTDRLLISFESATSSKDRWDKKRKLTEKKQENTVLPLVGGDGKPVFTKGNKCE